VPGGGGGGLEIRANVLAKYDRQVTGGAACALDRPGGNIDFIEKHKKHTFGNFL
jgi:hypothetical protein